MDKQYKYDAFISYRHCELDKFVAEKIHKYLESFKLPKNIRNKKEGGRGIAKQLSTVEVPSPLFLLSENREVDVATWAFLHVYEKGVSAIYCAIQTIINTAVV